MSRHVLAAGLMFLASSPAHAWADVLTDRGQIVGLDDLPEEGAEDGMPSKRTPVQPPGRAPMKHEATREPAPPRRPGPTTAEVRQKVLAKRSLLRPSLHLFLALIPLEEARIGGKTPPGVDAAVPGAFGFSLRLDGQRWHSIVLGLQSSLSIYTPEKKESYHTLWTTSFVPTYWPASLPGLYVGGLAGMHLDRIANQTIAGITEKAPTALGWQAGAVLGYCVPLKRGPLALSLELQGVYHRLGDRRITYRDATGTRLGADQLEQRMLWVAVRLGLWLL